MFAGPGFINAADLLVGAAGALGGALGAAAGALAGPAGAVAGEIAGGVVGAKIGKDIIGEEDLGHGVARMKLKK